jgi:hypothetical protein
MTWLGQVLHVARKDVQEEAWPLGGYLAVTAIASTMAFSQTLFRYGGPLATIVFLLGLVLAAAIVQSDSPIMSTSFWGSRPFQPTAMLGAKVLVVSLIVFVPAIAQYVALSALDVNGWQAVFVTAHSARVYVVWLLAAMVVAGLTRDVRTFIVSLAAMYYATIVLTAQLWDRIGGPALWTAIAVSGAIALLMLLYRRRDARRRMWIVAIVVVTSAVTAASMSEPTPANATTASTPAAMRMPIRVEVLYADRLGKDEYLNLRVAAGADPGPRRFVLAVHRVTVRLRDGTAMSVGEKGYSSVVVAAGNPLGSSIRWLHSESDLEPQFSLQLSPEQRSAISKGVTGLELSGSVYVLEPRIIAMVPITQQRSVTGNGMRLRILNATPASDGGELNVETVSVAQLQTTPSLSLGPIALRLRNQWALVNEARGEAVYPVQPRSSSGLDQLVLPSLRLATEAPTLQLKQFQGTVRDAAWFMGTRLALVGWTSRGRYDVDVPIVKVPTPD